MSLLTPEVQELEPYNAKLNTCQRVHMGYFDAPKFKVKVTLGVQRSCVPHKLEGSFVSFTEMLSCSKLFF